MIGFFRFQFIKQPVNGVFIFLVILSDFHGVQELKQRCEVLFIRGRFVMDVADQGTVQKRFRFRPELISGFSIVE